jgi:MSHA pilin protein MshC
MIATITIIAIIAAVTVPRLTSAAPAFNERGYTDSVVASLRLARSVAMASGCDVQFNITPAGYSALQRAASGTHCAQVGGFITPVRQGDGKNLEANAPAGATVVANQQVVFTSRGRIAGGVPVNIVIGPQNIAIDGSGWVQGP